MKRPWVAVLIVSSVFGAEHLYQGYAGAVQTFVIALIADDAHTVLQEVLSYLNKERPGGSSDKVPSGHERAT